MEAVKQLLTEAGVIGGIMDDFDPHMNWSIIYGDKQISLGDQVLPAEVQHRPHGFHYFYDPNSDIQEIFRNPTFIAVVMTDPDAPGGEYLHWLSKHFMGGQQEPDLRSQEPVTIELQSQDVFSYEAPRARRMGTHKIVFTVFKLDESPSDIFVPVSRENFSTRAFASANSLGAPLAASFFKINHQNENGYQELPTCNGDVR